MSPYHTVTVVLIAINTAFWMANASDANADLSAAIYSATLLPTPAGYDSTDGRDGFGAVQVGRGAGPATDGKFHALLWDSDTSSIVDLNPSGYSYSFAGSVHDGYQVGWVGGPTPEYATMWHGTAESAIDLHPAGFSSSNAYGISETNQVGWAFRREPHGDHAMIWSGTADSFVDLHPEQYIQSRAYEVSENYQVGYAIAGRGNLHAALWHGTAESFVDLNPAGFEKSFARSVDGVHQVGSGTPNRSSETHALLWQGSAADVVNLHPSGLRFSHASDVSGNVQVGFGRGSFNSESDHALLWHGSAESVVDLHKYVLAIEPGFQGSRAFDIEPNGDVVGEVWSSNRRYAVKWSLIPEPSTQFLASCVTFTLLSRRRYKTTQISAT